MLELKLLERSQVSLSISVLELSLTILVEIMFALAFANALRFSEKSKEAVDEYNAVSAGNVRKNGGG